MKQPADTAVSSQADRGWVGHPRRLSTLFFTGMWERFSFSGLRALLVLYMTAAVTQGGLAFPTDKATSIVGWYGFGVYAAAIPGGWIADRFLGQFRSVVIGGGLVPPSLLPLCFSFRPAPLSSATRLRMGAGAALLPH